MRAVITIAVLLLALAVALPPSVAKAQSVNGTEAQTLRDEIRRLNQRLDKLEGTNAPQVVPAAATAPATSTPPVEPVTTVAPAPSVSAAGIITAQVPTTTGDREI